MIEKGKVKIAIKGIKIILFILVIFLLNCLYIPINKGTCKRGLESKFWATFPYLSIIQSNENSIREGLQEQGYSPSEIEEKVQQYREIKRRAEEELIIVLLNIWKSYQDCLKYVEHKQKTLYW